jgi:hypothetical protein
MLFIGTIAPTLFFASSQDRAPSSAPVPEEAHVGPIRNAPVSSPSFTLTLSGMSPTYRVGSEIWIRIVQKNITSHTIDSSGTYGGGVDLAFHYDVRDEDDKPAAKVTYQHPELSPWNPFWSSIPAGESNDSEILISEIYEFDRLGKYVIQVSRPDIDFIDNKGNPVMVKSNVITITIKERVAHNPP